MLKHWLFPYGIPDFGSYPEAYKEQDPSFFEKISLLSLEQKQVIVQYIRYYQHKAEDPTHRAWLI